MPSRKTSTKKAKTTRKTRAKTMSKRSVRKRSSWWTRCKDRIAKLLPWKRKRGNKRKRAKSKTRKTPMRIILKWFSVLCVWGVIVMGIILSYFIYDLPDVRKLYVIEKNPSVTLLSRNNSKIVQIGDLYGEYLHYDDVPPALIEAVLATEDRRFFSHFGIDIIGIMRAFYTNYRAGKVVQGGSTVTQQLAKIVFLTPERTLKRKVQEALIALWLEYKLTKKQILTIYLNRVYLGAGNYGVDAAARFYFGHSAKTLNLRQSAMLAGLLKAPTRYSPTNNRDLAEKRTNQVLINMERAGYRSFAEIRRANKQWVDISAGERHKDTYARYFADYVMEQLPQYIGRIDRDVIVTTTLDVDLQRHAQQEIAYMIDLYGKEKAFSQSALVSLSPKGEVLAMVGGKSYAESQFNRATQARRQPGSAFKLFVYLTALEKGYTPYVTMEDAPIRIGDWSPKNYTNRYRGTVRLQEAFADSINTIAVKLAKEVGVRNVINYAKSMGITTPLHADLGLALGTNEVSLLELTAAYGHVANQGYSVTPFAITSIKERNGKVLYQRNSLRKRRILSRSTIRHAHHMLNEVVEEGTGKNAALGRRAVAGKTGTSQKFRDAWFIGYTSDMVTGIWMGNDDNSPMLNVSGGSLPTLLWKGVMESAHEGKPHRALGAGGERKGGWFDWFDGSIEYTYPGQRKR